MRPDTQQLLVDLLASVEWIDTQIDYDESALCCPFCAGLREKHAHELPGRSVGHADDCSLMEALAQLQNDDCLSLWHRSQEKIAERAAKKAFDELAKWEAGAAERANDASFERWLDSKATRRIEEDDGN